MSSSHPWKELTVDIDGPRVDVWLAAQVEGLSRREAVRLVEEGNVLLDGRRVRKSTSVAAGQVVTLLQGPTPKEWAVSPNPSLALDVVHGDPAFIVVNKPHGMPSTALTPDDTGTLANAIAARFPGCATLGRNGDGGLLHRLDTATSGLLLVARHQQSYDTLRQMQENSQLEKRYFAMVAGTPNIPTTLSQPLASAGGGKRVVVQKGGNKAVTHLQAALPMGGFTLLDVLIYKGFRHQIRVHLAHLGHPICGDDLYNGPRVDGLDRLCLHAHQLNFEHPVNGKPIGVQCPLPPQWKRATAE